ncbi:ABC transporter substrate-binding protein [Mycetocola sp.]|uniref:ABC transporter substrate-binding protein n=1 Tax=Mycetocola sp. TaxID=1871042 RepID=UPI00398A50BF
MTDRDVVRFLWRSGSRWYGIRLDRVRRREHGPDQAILVGSLISLPRGITSREIDVLTLIALGLTNVEVAQRLGTQSRTVSTQIERLLNKLSQTGRAGLAAIAVDSGLIVLPIPGGAEGVTSIVQVSIQQNAATMDTSSAGRESLDVSFPARAPFLLGTVAPLSGPAGADGIELVRGSTMAVSEINARGGIDGRLIEHVTEDADIFNPDAVRRAFEALFARGVDAITTSYLSAENPFVLDLVADYGRPFLHTATLESQVELVRAQPTRYSAVFQTCPSEKYYRLGFLRLINELANSGKWRPLTRRVVAIEVDVASSQIANDDLRVALTDDGWDVADVVRVPLKQANWTDIVADIARHEPDVVLVTHFLADEIVALQAQIHRSKLKTLVYYVYAASIPQFQLRSGEAAEGVIWSTVTGRYDDAMGQRFQREFLTRFGEEPGWSQASAAYDQVYLLAAAWTEAGSGNPRKVSDHLRKSVYRGLNGVYFLGSPGQAALCYPDETTDSSLGQALMTFQIQSGQPVILGPNSKGSVAAFRSPWATEHPISQNA